MQAKEHPQFAEEQRHLEDSVRYIRENLERYGTPVGYGGDFLGAQASRQVRVARVAELRQVIDSPYFGRLDIRSVGDEEPNTYYLGLVEISEKGIYSWQSPKLAPIYYRTRVLSPDEALLLKRTYDIKKRNLVVIVDEYIAPGEEERYRQTEPSFVDDFLRQLLHQSRGGRLREIVATIRQQQFEVISMPREVLLVVQGASGSGKTQVALHRLSYLLYQHRRSSDFQAQNLLVLGPTPLFLDYIGNVLPTLGDRHIPQKTFDQWLRDRLESDVEPRSIEESLEFLLDAQRPIAERVMHYRNVRFKGSLKMAELLERHIEAIYGEIVVNCRPLEIALVSSVYGRRSAEGRWTLIRSPEQMVPFFEKARRLALNQRREDVERQLATDLLMEVDTLLRAQRGKFDLSEQRARMRGEITQRVHQHFESWRALNPLVLYRQLLHNPGLLTRAGRELGTTWDLELLRLERVETLDAADLPALLYLKILLDGTGAQRYDHIVVDEAQDISPLFFKILLRYSRGGSMTVLGDMAQGIHRPQEETRWETLTEAKGELPMSQQTMRTSYRATCEIVTYANALLARIGTDPELLAEPFGRSDRRHPQQHPCADRALLEQTLASIVKEEQDHGWRSITVLCKTKRDCRALATALETALGERVAMLAEPSDRYQGEVAVMPIYLAKGLEFDVVIIADADAATYSLDMLHAHLLYVGLTRAAHMLHVCCVGEMTPLLDPHWATRGLPYFSAELQGASLTIQEYVEQRPHLDPDACVQRLANIGKLSLLRQGRMDPVLLELLLATGGMQEEGQEVLTASALSEAEYQAVSQQVQRWERFADPVSRRALAVSQLGYGLLRHTMRKCGLSILDEEDGSLADQITALLALRRHWRGGKVASSNRWTTRQRVLRAVSSVQREEALELLQQLFDVGLVEQADAGEREQVRPASEWIDHLLDLALSRQPRGWDVGQLAQVPRLPEPLVVGRAEEEPDDRPEW